MEPCASPQKAFKRRSQLLMERSENEYLSQSGAGAECFGGEKKMKTDLYTELPASSAMSSMTASFSRFFTRLFINANLMVEISHVKSTTDGLYCRESPKALAISILFSTHVISTLDSRL